MAFMHSWTYKSGLVTKVYDAKKLHMTVLTYRRLYKFQPEVSSNVKPAVRSRLSLSAGGANWI